MATHSLTNQIADFPPSTLSQAVSEVAWSPDGHQISAVEYEYGNSGPDLMHLYVVDLRSMIARELPATQSIGFVRWNSSLATT